MGAIEEQTGWHAGHDGSSLFFRQLKITTVRFQVVVAHGLGEHSGRYAHVARTLCPLGAALWIHDHRGHGRSPGRRGHIASFEEYLLDLERFIGEVRDDRLPLLLLGHSMGGLIALSFARRYPQLIDGLILSSPLLGLPSKPPFVVSLARLLSRTWPTLSFNSGLDPTFISHDPGVVQAYRDDRWVHGKVSVRWFTQCLEAIAANVNIRDPLPLPLLVQIAGDDRLVKASAALAYFDALAAADKTLRFYPSLFHEVYNEKLPERREVLGDLRRWVENRYL